MKSVYGRVIKQPVSVAVQFLLQDATPHAANTTPTEIQ